MNIILNSDGIMQKKSEIEKILPSDIFIVKQFGIRGSNNHSRLVSGLNHSDVALLLGGGSGTFTTGIAAVAMKHPTLALPQFGGAADQVWQILVPYYARGPFNQNDIERLGAMWNEESPHAVALALKKIRTDNPFQEKIEVNELVLSIISIVIVGIWIALFMESGDYLIARPTRFFLLAGLATALGSATRNIVRCYFDLEVRFSLGRFIAEFVLGVIVSFILFLSVQLGGVVVSGTTMSLDMKDLAQFQRLAIAMSLIGFAASYLIETSLERLRSRLTNLLDEATSSSSSARSR
jgi:hypothetical protein